MTVAMNGDLQPFHPHPHFVTCVERFPEQYPAVLDEWAEPVPSDNADMAALRPLLKNTNLEFRGLKLTYSANRDGWNANKFHQKVDKLGGGLVVCTTKDGLVCGGCKSDTVVWHRATKGFCFCTHVATHVLAIRQPERMGGVWRSSRIHRRIFVCIQARSWRTTDEIEKGRRAKSGATRSPRNWPIFWCRFPGNPTGREEPQDCKEQAW